jgi:trans-2-enoyl-CoA reductase
MKKMKRVHYEQFGAPTEVLKTTEAPPHILRDGEVRVDVLSAPIHNADILQIMGLYGTTPILPATPGGEAVGRVVEISSDVTQLTVGATVFIPIGQTWSQQVTGPASAFMQLPPGDLDQLAMLVSSPATAHLMLSNYVELEHGDWIIQSAANSAVGSAVVQLAKQRGLRTINIVRRESVVSDLTQLGADVVLVGTDNLLEKIYDATGGASVKLALDAIGGPTFGHLIDVLEMGGTLVSYSQVVHEPAEVMPGTLIFKQLNIHGFWLTQWFLQASNQDKQDLFAHLISLVTTGQLKLAVDSSYSLNQITDAVARATAGRRNGKVMLHPNGPLDQ